MFLFHESKFVLMSLRFFKCAKEMELYTGRADTVCRALQSSFGYRIQVGYRKKCEGRVLTYYIRWAAGNKRRSTCAADSPEFKEGV